MRALWRLKLDLWLQSIVVIALTAMALWRIGSLAVQLVVAGIAIGYLLLLLRLRHGATSSRAIPPLSVFAAITGVYLSEFYLMHEMGGLSKQNEVLRLRSTGQRAFPALPPATWYFAHFRKNIDQQLAMLPLAGLSNVLTVYCNERSGWTIYLADEHGFRNPRNPTRSTAGERIALIGDSFVQGACVPDAKTLSGVLRTRGWQAENYGVAGDGPLLELATLQEYVLPLNPSKVVWFFYEGNDIRDLALEMTAPPIIRYLTDGPYQQLMTRQREIDTVLEAGVKAIEQSESRIDFLQLKRLRTALNLSGIGAAADTTSPIEPILPNLKSVLERASQLIHANGSRMLFVYLPTADRFRDEPHYYVNMEKQVIRIACAAHINTLSVSSRLNNDARSLQYFTNLGGHYGHLNESGYALVADLVHQSLNGEIGDSCTRL